MLTQRIPFFVIKTPHIFKQFSRFSYGVKNIQKPILFKFSSNHSSSKPKNQPNTVIYEPIRPLKKQLTELYVEKNYLNKGEVIKPIRFWPYLTPFYAMIINNFLTEWSLVNSAISSVLFFAGILLRVIPRSDRSRTVIKLQCTNDMKKYYMTVPFSSQNQNVSKLYPNNYAGLEKKPVFSDLDVNNIDFKPTEEQKRTLTEYQLRQKKLQHDSKVAQKILLQQRKDNVKLRFELDASKTSFKLANKMNEIIKDMDVMHPESELKGAQMFDIPYKYLIIRTEFLCPKRQKPMHYFIDLEENGDLKYQDYLAAIGANYKIVLSSEPKNK